MNEVNILRTESQFIGFHRESKGAGISRAKQVMPSRGREHLVFFEYGEEKYLVIRDRFPVGGLYQKLFTSYQRYVSILNLIR